MKKVIFNLIALMLTVNIWAQAPQMMSYQAVIRDANDDLVASATVGMKFSVLQGSPSGTPVYVETQSPMTNTNGLVSLQIGSGTVESGSLSGIDWSAGPYYLMTETDPAGGTDYTISGTSELTSVPYALYAASSGSEAAGWGLQGNSGTSDTLNFIGTTDDVPVNIKVNNQFAGRIDSVSGNTFLGFRAGNFPQNAGTKNSALGYYTMLKNTTGNNNTALGYASLRDNTVGSNNTGIGFCQMTFNTTGQSNTALGTWALFKNTTASYNTAIGDSALFENTTGSPNTAVGYGSMEANTTGSNNTSVGYLSMLKNTTGMNNTSLGHASLRDNTVGSNNTGIGFCQMTFNTTGQSNTALGTWALFKNTTASYNTAVGDSALFENTTGAGNTSVGYGALVNNTTGSNNTAIGYLADAGAASSNSTVIGYQATAAEDNVIVLGNASIQKLYCAQTTITAISDRRFKKNISPDIHGLDFITRLKPVSYNLDVSKLNAFEGKEVSEMDRESVEQAEHILHNGFIAQDVEQAAREVNYNFSGLKTPKDSHDTYGLGYTDFVVPLVKAVQELNEANEDLKAENAMLKTQLEEQKLALREMQIMQGKNEAALAELKNLVNSHSDFAQRTK